MTTTPAGQVALGLRVSDIQRVRMISAMIEVAVQRGAGNVTASDVVAKARVSRRTFYELFASCEDCLLAAIDCAISRTAEQVLPAYQAEAQWQAKIRAGLTAMLELFDEQPTLARLLVVETLAGGPQARRRRRNVLDRLACALDDGRRAGHANGPLPGLTGEALVGAVFSILHARLAYDERGSLATLVPELMSLIVTPYRGAAAGRRELQRREDKITIGAQPPGGRAAHPQAAGPQSAGDPKHASPPSAGPQAAHDLLSDIHLRLTRRTLGMLDTVAEHPGCSNRMLAEHAGMRDQGQASKLLQRLQDHGMIENTSGRAAHASGRAEHGAGPGSKGTANTWRLSELGRELRALVESHIA